MVNELSDYGFTFASWQALHVAVDRCAEGPPAGPRGTFTGTVLTLCHLLSGRVEMEKAGVWAKARAEQGRWIVCMPGERWQDFSEGATLVSIHFAVRSPGNGAEWRGTPIMAFEPDAPARRAMDRLRRVPILRGMTREQRLHLTGVELPLHSMLELSEAGMGLFRQVLRLVRPLGLRYEVPAIQDERVAASHQQLAARDVRLPFSRAELAAGQGLTPGQLDRLWRRELGTTPQRYVDHRRFLYAVERLRRDDIPVKVIAAELGFRHLSQFSNWFAERQGESPRKFRGGPGIS